MRRVGERVKLIGFQRVAATDGGEVGKRGERKIHAMGEGKGGTEVYIKD